LKVGIRLPTFVLPDERPTAATLFQYARTVEELGFDSIFLIDHLLTAAPSYPVTWYDCLAMLSAVAACTRRIRIGTLVLVLPLYHPLHLAKALATIDRLSGGRLVAGFGVGWSHAEFDAVGIPHRTRGQRMDECLRIVMDLWTKDDVSFNGRYYRSPPVSLEPKPLQQPHPPIWIGGGRQPFERIYGMQVKDVTPALQRIARYADGWSYHLSSTPEMIGQDWHNLTSFAAQVGRNPADIEIVYSNFIHVTDTPSKHQPYRDVLTRFSRLSMAEMQQTYLLGGSEAILARIEQTRRATEHIDHAVLNPLTWDSQQLIAIADHVLPGLR
jgi:probable F420-dependent oxidoreductase